MGPIMNKIGNLQYVVVTLVGALMSIRRGRLRVGSLAAFLRCPYVLQHDRKLDQPF
jgi:hypothetical protein